MSHETPHQRHRVILVPGYAELLGAIDKNCGWNALTHENNGWTKACKFILKILDFKSSKFWNTNGVSTIRLFVKAMLSLFFESV